MTTARQGRAARLAAALEAFLRASDEVEAVAVVSHDGLPMATALPDGLESDRVAAMSAALLALGEQVSAGLGRGHLEQLMIEGDHGSVFVTSAQGAAVLVVLAGPDAKIGMIRFEIGRAAEQVGQALREQDPPVDADGRPDLGLVRGAGGDGTSGH